LTKSRFLNLKRHVLLYIKNLKKELNNQNKKAIE